MNAVQGARIAGAERIVTLDPAAFKREKALELGATRVVANVDEAWDMVSELTWGRMADAAIITTDVAEGAYIGQACRWSASGAG